MGGQRFVCEKGQERKSDQAVKLHDAKLVLFCSGRDMMSER